MLNRPCSLAFLALALATSACGSSDDGGLKPGDSGGAGGEAPATTGGAPSTGGAAGGAAGQQQSAAGGGGGPTAGVKPSDDPCEPNPNPEGAALCLTFEPEKMATVDGETQIDGKGLLIVQIYDRPDPEKGATPLAETVFPDPKTDPGVEVGIEFLSDLRFEDLPETVYVRTQFIDDDLNLQGTLRWGAWVGGSDFSDGVVGQPIQPVTLTKGQGTSLTQELTAFRLLIAKVTASATPLDDAIGPMLFAAWSDAELSTSARLFGHGAVSCGDVSNGGQALLPGYVVGPGPHYVRVKLDDFGLGGDPTPGSLESGAVEVTFGATEYAKEVEIDLTTVVPGNGSPSHSCQP